MICFGPAGNSESFHQEGFKKTVQVPKYLSQKELNAFEYQCGRGVKIKQEAAQAFGDEAKKYGIWLSVHAPYYISLSSVEKEKREKSLDYILQSAQAVDWMGGTRIVVHSGSASSISREQALEYAKDTLKKARVFLDDNGYEHIVICPETMGKVQQLGTLEEVLSLCQVDERMIPCIDFGHLNARTFGGLGSKEDFCHIFDLIENTLGNWRAKHFHVHFSKIEYTLKGGEKKHLTFEDEQFGPDYQPFIELCVEREATPCIICESAGTQAEDAVVMKNYYNHLMKASLDEKESE